MANVVLIALLVFFRLGRFCRLQVVATAARPEGRKVGQGFSVGPIW